MENFSIPQFVSVLRHTKVSKSLLNTGLFWCRFVAIFILLVSGVSMTDLEAQTNSAEPGSEVITTDAYTFEVWKKSTDYSAVLTAEKNSNDIKLAEPGLSGEQFALYTGYDKLLGYMQSDLASKSPIENIASANYKRIISESTTDPVLLKMKIPEFNTKFNSLVMLLLK